MDRAETLSIKNKPKANVNLIIFSMYYIGTMIFDLNEKYLLISQALFILLILSSSWLIIRTGKIALKPYALFLVVVLITFFITALFGINYSNSVTRLSTLLKIFAMCIMVYPILSAYMTEKYLEKLFLIAGIVFFAWVLYVYGITNYFTSILSSTERLGAEVSQENVMGMNASIIASVLLYFVINKKKYSYLLVISMMITVIAASGSKKALFIIPLAILIILIQKNGLKKLYKTFIGITIFAVLCSLAIRLQMFSGLRERISGFFMQLQGTNVDSSTELRYYMIKYGLIWFGEHPLLGIGIDNYKYLSVNLFGIYRYSHNNYIELLVGTGIVGSTAFYSIYLFLINKLLKLRECRNAIAQILLLVLILQLFCDIASVSYLYKSTYIYLIMAFACVDKGMESSTNKSHQCSKKYRIKGVV